MAFHKYFLAVFCTDIYGSPLNTSQFIAGMNAEQVVLAKTPSDINPRFIVLKKEVAFNLSLQ